MEEEGVGRDANGVVSGLLVKAERTEQKKLWEGLEIVGPSILYGQEWKERE